MVQQTLFVLSFLLAVAGCALSPFDSVRTPSSTSQAANSADTLKDLEELRRCAAYIQYLWPPTVNFRSASCAPPSMTRDEQSRLRAFVIERYGLNSKDSRARQEGFTAFNKDMEAVKQDKISEDTQKGLDRAWQCKPANKLGVFALKLDLLFRNPACSPPAMTTEEQNRLRAVLMSFYGSYGRGPQTFERDRIHREGLDRSAQADEARRTAQLEQQRAEEQEQVSETQKKETEDAAREERERLLKSGKIKVENFNDAVLYLKPTYPLFDIIASPLLSPDRRMYSGGVILDALQEKNVLRVSPTYAAGPLYAFLKITEKTINYAPQGEMRLGNGFNVIGKYVDNRNYRTVSGTTKTAPVLEVLYMDTWPR
jgi:hypothetical protein